MLYFDNHSVAKPIPELAEIVAKFSHDDWGSYTQPHPFGQKLLTQLKEAYEKLYQALGLTEKDTVIMTASGSEAVSQVFESIYFHTVKETGKNHLLTLSTENAPIILAMEKWEKLGCKKDLIAVNELGYLEPERLVEAISPRTAILSLSLAHGLSGVIQPLDMLLPILKDRGILLHLDISYAFGKSMCELQDLDPDFVTCSGSVLHAPQGTGFLYVKNPNLLTPMIMGGNEQGGLRGGALNMGLAVALGSAIEQAYHHMDYMCTEMARLRDLFETTLVEKIPGSVALFQDSYRLPNVSVISFPGIVAESLAFYLAQQQLYANFGGGKFQKLSYVLEACGVDAFKARGALSFAMSRFTTEQDIIRSVEVIAEQAHFLQQFSKHILHI